MGVERLSEKRISVKWLGVNEKAKETLGWVSTRRWQRTLRVDMRGYQVYKD